MGRPGWIVRRRRFAVSASLASLNGASGGGRAPFLLIG
jgi:hypothetical protein